MAYPICIKFLKMAMNKNRCSELGLTKDVIKIINMYFPISFIVRECPDLKGKKSRRIKWKLLNSQDHPKSKIDLKMTESNL